MLADLVKPLEVEAPSLHLDHFLIGEIFVAIVAKVAATATSFLETRSTCCTFPLTVSATLTISTKGKSGSRTPQRALSRITL